MPEDAAPKKKNNKRLSVERIYQKKTQLEHIILRPDSYIGSVEPLTQNMFVWSAEHKAIISKSITYTPGLYKIFDEIIGMCLYIVLLLLNYKIFDEVNDRYIFFHSCKLL